MNNFYGGQAGKDFSLAKVFNNKKEALEDLEKGIASSVSVGEFIVISYGDRIKYPLLSSKPVTDNLQTDYYFIKKGTEIELYKTGNPSCINTWTFTTIIDKHEISTFELNLLTDNNQSYNACFYVKDYDSEGSFKKNDLMKGGWFYRFIAQMLGPTPVFKPECPVEYKKIDKPQISIDSSNVEEPQLSMLFPSPTATAKWTDGLKKPIVNLNPSNQDGWSFDFEFPIPFVDKQLITQLNPLEIPTVTIEVAKDFKFDFEFELPRAPQFHPYDIDNPPTTIPGDIYFCNNGQIRLKTNSSYDLLFDFFPRYSQTYSEYASAIDGENEEFIVNKAIINMEYHKDPFENGSYKLNFITPKAPVFNFSATEQFYSNNEEINPISIVSELTEIGYDINFYIPKAPKFNFTATEIPYANENGKINLISLDSELIETGYNINFSIPKAPEFNIKTDNVIVDSSQKGGLEVNRTTEGYDLEFKIPQGAPLVIWNEIEPLQLFGSALELKDIEIFILDYLNQVLINQYPTTSGELLPITYIYSLDAPNAISTDENGEDLSEYGIDSYGETEISKEELSGIESAIELVNENTYLISEKTILGFFGYYTDKWNIFLAPNGGGAGSLKWEIYKQEEQL